MYVVIFTAEINQLDETYLTTARKMRKLATDKYGCIDFISVTEGSKEISISYWSDCDDIARWKNDPEHLDAQVQGKERWYRSHQVQIAKVERGYSG